MLMHAMRTHALMLKHAHICTDEALDALVALRQHAPIQAHTQLHER